MTSPARLYDPSAADAARAARPRQPLNARRALERAIADALRLALICPRKACRRAGRCRSHPLMCLDEHAATVPGEAYKWAERMTEARARREDVEELEEDYADEALAFECWVAGVEARARRGRR